MTPYEEAPARETDAKDARPKRPEIQFDDAQDVILINGFPVPYPCFNSIMGGCRPGQFMHFRKSRGMIIAYALLVSKEGFGTPESPLLIPDWVFEPNDSN